MLRLFKIIFLNLLNLYKENCAFKLVRNLKKQNKKNYYDVKKNIICDQIWTKAIFPVYEKCEKLWKKNCVKLFLKLINNN